MKKVLFPLVLFLWSWVSVEAQSGSVSRMELASDKLKIEFGRKSDGWHITAITANGKPFPNPKGYYTLIYLNRNPAGGLVEIDIEGKAFTFYPEYGEKLPDGSLRFSQKLRWGTVDAIWQMDPEFAEDVRVRMTVKMDANGSVSIGTPTVAVFGEDEISWGMVPGNWYGTEVNNNVDMFRKYSQGIPCIPQLGRERNTMTLCPLITNKDKMTLAVIPDPGTENDPYPNDRIDRSANKVACSIMNRHNELTPGAYAPVLGQEGSKRKAGEEVSFGFRYTIRDSDWFDVFQHAVNDVFKLPGMLDIQTNKMSLAERVSRLQKYLRDEKKSKWSTWESRGYEIGANGSKIADAGTMYMIACNGDDETMRSRLPYVRNYKLAQQQAEPGFFQGAALGEYADEDGVESERGNWIEPLHTTYYSMVDFANMLLFDPSDRQLADRLRLAAEKLLLWQHPDGSFDVGYDRFSQNLAFPDLQDYRPTWYGLLIAYNALKDSRYLAGAEAGARWQIENGVNKGYYLGVCGDARNIWDFCTAQTSQAYIDLYEATKNEAYKKAAIDAAKIYTTSIFTHPIATNETRYVNGVAVKDWEINQTGLGVEHIRGTAGGGPILISSYAGLFTRIYEWTREPIFLTMARVAARGRNAFVEQESGCAIYYWSGLDKVKESAVIFPWHAYWQIGWIVDYLMEEAKLRSGGKVSFPYGYMTPKVGPHVTYGFAPGSIYGKTADLLFRPGMVHFDNQDVEYLCAASADKQKLYIIVLSQSPRAQSATMTLDLSQFTGKPASFKKVNALQGKTAKVTPGAGKISFNFAPWGMNVIEVSL